MKYSIVKKGNKYFIKYKMFIFWVNLRRKTFAGANIVWAYDTKKEAKEYLNWHLKQNIKNNLK